MTPQTMTLADVLESKSRERARAAFDAAMREPWQEFMLALGRYMGAQGAAMAGAAAQVMADDAFQRIRNAALPKLDACAIRATAAAIETVASRGGAE